MITSGFKVQKNHLVQDSLLGRITGFGVRWNVRRGVRSGHNGGSSRAGLTDNWRDVGVSVRTQQAFGAFRTANACAASKARV